MMPKTRTNWNNFRLTAPELPEHDLQKSVVKYLQLAGWRTEFNGVFEVAKYIHDANMKFAEIRYAKSMGASKGYPDLTAHKGSRTIYIEFKTESGRQSPEQKEWQTYFEENGKEYYIVRSIFDLRKKGF